MRRILASGPSRFQLSLAYLLGSDVGDRQALLSRKAVVRREVLLQGFVDVAGSGVLALHAVGVVAVHAAQQNAQLLVGRRRGRRAKGGCRSRQVAGALEERANPRLLGISGSN